VTGASGYATLYTASPPTPLLSPRYHGCEFVDRGAVLVQGQSQRSTPIERNNALTANGVAGYGVTLPRATAPLVYYCVNADPTATLSVWALPGLEQFGPADWPPRYRLDSINGMPNATGFTLAPNASATFTAGPIGQWTAA
jgi:hypothetical protein